MNPLVLLTIYTFTFTAPRWMVGDTTGCSPDTTRPARLGYALVEGWPRYGGPTPVTLLNIPLVGQEGTMQTFTLDLSGIWTIAVVTVGGNGWPSCPSNMVTVGGTTSVPPSSPTVEQPTYYDILGRRIGWPPPHSGVYFKRLGGKVVRITYFP